MSERPSKRAKTASESKSTGGGKVPSLEMHDDLQAALARYRSDRAFNPEQWIQDKCRLFNEYMAKCKLSACVVSVSGGVDSAVTLGLMKRASTMPGSPIKRVMGVAQPIKSSAWALNRGKEAATSLGVELVVVDQTDLHSQLQTLGKSFASGQLRSYMRTPVGYYVAQLLSQSGTPCVVMGTGNKDEDGYLAYFCKAGDGVVDVQLIADIHKSEVFSVARALNLPMSIIEAAPSADLWDGQTDEEELGFSYDFIELYTGYYLPMSDQKKAAFTASLAPEAKGQFEAWAEMCSAVHRRNAHKLTSPHNINIL